MSALDILAMATGAFVVMVTLMMPYYQRVLDAEAATDAARESTASAMAEAASLEEETASTNASAGQIESEMEAAAAEFAAMDEEMAEITRQIGALKAAAARPPAPSPVPEHTLQSTVVDRLDVVFVIDTTASMRSVIRELSLSLSGIVRVLERLVPSVRVGFAAYTDRDTGYQPVRTLPLTETKTGLNRVLGFARSLGPPPRGSRTVDEDVELGLGAAMGMAWRQDAVRVILVIGDARAHPQDRGRTMAMANRFRSAGAKNAVSTLFVSTRSSRREGDVARGFFRQLAGAGGGTFNDHTGQIYESVILSVLVN
ncbi:MAG: vWA domain-containing protein [Pseudomonadota bacterium]